MTTTTTARGDARRALEGTAARLTERLLERAQHAADFGVTESPDDALAAKNWASVALSAGQLFQTLGRIPESRR
jgi:hypothetical protein